MSSPPESDVGDLFAGCFLSLAGSLVGSAIGTVALVIRMLPEVNLLALVGGFAAGFIGGVVVGAIATFAAAPIANGIGGRRAENIWIGAVASAAAIGAALTAWLVIPS
jgi:hypothetical protein